MADPTMVTIYKIAPCPECQGEGVIDNGAAPCLYCRGDGEVQIEKRITVEELRKMLEALEEA